MPELKFGTVVTVFVNDEQPVQYVVGEIHTPANRPQHPNDRVGLYLRNGWRRMETSVGVIRPPEPGKRNYWHVEYDGPLFPTET